MRINNVNNMNLYQYRNEQARRTQVACGDCGRRIPVLASRFLDGKHLCLEHFMQRAYGEEK